MLQTTADITKISNTHEQVKEFSIMHIIMGPDWIWNKYNVSV